MNSLAEWIQALWPVATAVVFVIVWLVRLEMAQKRLAEKCKEFATLYTSCSKRQEKWNDEIRNQLSLIATSQARMEGMVSVIHKNTNGKEKHEDNP